MKIMRKNFVSLFLPVLLVCCCMIFAFAVSCFADYSPTAIAEDGGISADLSFSIIDGQETSGEQSYAEIYDNNFDTKYCISIQSNPYVVFKAGQEFTVVDGYTLYTANDTETHSGRNPKSWKLYGSNNASDWTVIHNVENDSTLKATNEVGYNFTFTNTIPYRFYKFEFLSRHGATGDDYNLMQLSEIDFSASISSLQTVSDAESLATIFTNGGRAKLTADITLTEDLSVYAKSVEVDLNGHVISDGTITAWAASPSGDSIFVISDSNPNATHSDDSLPNGGVIHNLEFNRKNTADQKDETYKYYVYLYANGGSVINSLHSATGNAFVTYSKNTMTHFLGGASGVEFKLNGGVFYKKVETDNGVAFDTNTDVNKVTFSYVVNNAQTVYAYEYVPANSSPVKPFDIVPTEKNVRFYGWNVGGGYLSDFSANITADTTYSAVMVKDVASVDNITTAVNNGYSVKLTQSITFTEELQLASDGQFVLLDINGCVLSSSDINKTKIKLVGAAKANPTEVIIIDSRPTTTHANANYPMGGYINCEITMDAGWNTKEVKVYANGGTIKKVYSNSGAGFVLSTSTTPSVIQETVTSGNITVSGGLFYYNLERLGGNKLTFMNGDTVYAVAATNASTMVAPKSPAKEGYSFEGWYNGNTLYDFTTPITSALTLTAKWKDIVAPEVSGVDADSVYCQEIEVSVTDSSSFTVTVNELDVTLTDGKFTLDMSDGVDKTIVVTDIDGNVTTIIAKFGHSFGDWVNAVEPTCTSVGNLKYRQCSVATCKQYEYVTSSGQTLTCAEGEYDTKIKLAVVDHTYGDWVNAVEPTCTSVGNLKYRQCSVATCKQYEYVTSGGQTLTCAAGEYDTKIKLAVVDHTYGDWVNAVDATCTSVGNLKYRQCSVSTCKGYEYITSGGQTLTCAEGEYDTKIKLGKLPHSYNNGRYHESSGKHYNKCDNCDYYDTSTETACDADGLLITDLTHSVCCSVCQATNGNLGVNHTFDIPKSDDNNHWNECSCGKINASSVIAHDYNQVKNDDNNHWNECSCGKMDSSSVTAHTWNPDHDDTHHWQECTCGAIKEKDEHWYKSGSIVCNDCTYSLTVIDSLSFVVSGYERDGSIRDFRISLTPNAGVSTDFNTYISLTYEKAVENHEYIKLAENEYDYFLPGVPYWVWIVIDASSSKYTFLGTTVEDITVNGAQVVEIYNDNNNTTAYIGLRLPDIAGSTAIDDVSEINLTMTGYVEGGTVGNVVIESLPSDSDITYGYYLVRDIDNSGGANSTFDKNKQYYLLIEIFAKEGYTLYNLDRSMVTLNETIPCLGFEPGGSNGYAILIFILPSLYGTHDHVNNENEWKPTTDGTKHYTICSLCYEELTPEDHVYTDESPYTCTLCGYENITDITEFNFTLTGFEVDALLKNTTISINDGEVGYTITSSAYYTGFTILNRTIYDAFSSMNSYSENTTARFMTGVKYCFQLFISIQDGYSCNEFDPNNVKLNGVSATTGGYMGQSGNTLIAFFDMPVFTEGSEYTTIDAELTLEGYVAGGAYSDFDVTTTYEGIGNIEVRLLKHMGGELDLTSSNSFTNMDAYILELTITSADGYTIAEMDENSISFTDSSQILYFRSVMYDILYESITYTWYLKHLNPDHEHVYTLTYWDDNGHWMECPTCHAANQSSPHTYAEDDPYHCTTSGCNYSIPEKVTEINITLDGFSIGHLLSSAQISDGQFGTNSTLALKLVQSIFATSASVLEEDFSSIIEDSKYKLLDSSINYYLCLVFMYNPYLDFSLLTKETITLNDTKSASLYTPKYIEDDYCLVIFDLGKVYVDHIHGGTWVNAVEADCENDGVIGHYECTICAKYFDADDNELSTIVDPAIGHKWNLAFCDIAAANGEGNFHDYKCSNCNSWQGNRESCNIDTKWITDDDYHWHECSVCEHKFNYGEHNHVILCDSSEHWECCSVCDKSFSEKTAHTFDSETSTDCSLENCPYHRYFNVEIDLSGYGVNELLTGFSGSATNKTDNIVMSLDFADFYNENYDKVGSTSVSGNIDYMARFRAEKVYFVDLYFNCGSYYPADTLTSNNFTLPEGYVFAGYDYETVTASNGSSYVQLNVFAYMPLLGGVNNSQEMPEIELTIENFVVGKALSEVNVSADISTAIIGELVFSKHTTIIDKTTVITNNELIGLQVYISASEGYDFIGYSIDSLSLSSNIGEIMGVTISNSGSAITVGIELRGVIGEHECVYTTYKNPNGDILDNPYAETKHRKVCSICGKYVYEDHDFDDYLDKDCSLCNYTRSVVLDRLDIILTNYVVDGLVGEVCASIAENDYNVAVVGSYNSDYGIFDSNMKRYFGRVSRFLPNEQYYLNVKVTAASIVNFETVSNSNVYVNGEAVTVYSSSISSSSGIISYTLALPMLGGTTTQQKATDIDFTISGLTLGGTVGDVALGELTHSAVAAYDFEIFKKGESTALSSTFTFVSDYQYVLKVRVKLNDYYYSKGMTDGDITVGNLSRVGDIVCYDERFNYTGVGSLVFYTFQIVFDMGEDHVHAFTGSDVTYDSNANGHAPICECGFVGERVAHTYTQASPTVCSVCGAPAIPEKLEFTLSHYYIGMPTYIDENSEVQITYNQNLLQIEYSGLTHDYDFDNQNFGASFDIVLPDRTYAFMIIIFSEVNLMQYSGDQFILNLGDKEYTSSFCYTMGENNMYMASIAFELPAIEGVHIHGGTWINEIPATCTTEGVKGHYDCTICDKHFDADNVEITNLTISVIDHSYGTWIKEIPSDCESDGVKGHYQCSVCNAYFDAEHNVLTSLVLSAKGHNYGDLHDTKDATCLADGYEEYYKCSDCNKYFNSSKVEKNWDDLVIDAHGHNFGTVSYSWNSVNSECIATRSCTHNCNEEGHTQTASATISSIVTQERSCVDPELTTYTATFAENWCVTQTKPSVQTKSPAGHIDNNNDHKCDVCTNVSSVCVDGDDNGRCDICGESMCETCIDENRDHKCDNCGSTMGTHVAPADSHNCSYCGKPITSCIDSDLDHKCDICSTSMGVHQGQENSHNCAYCGKKATDHEGGTATCIKKATCSICGEEYGSLAGHVYGEWIEQVDAKCGVDGAVAHKECSVCKKNFDAQGNVIDSIVIEALEHSFGEIVSAKEATCVESGYEAYYKCSACNKYFNSSKVEKAWSDLVIDAKGHSYGDWIDEAPADCETTGTKGHYHCSACDTDFDIDHNKLSSLVIPVKGHTYGDWIEQVDAKCGVDGAVAHKECSVCKKNFDAQGNVIDSIVIEALEHNFGEIVSAKEATCTEGGYEAYYKCSACNKYFNSSKVEKAWSDLVIDAKGHSYGDWIDEAPAGCETTGTKGHYHCSACDTDFDIDHNKLSSLVIPVKGHTYGNKVDEQLASCLVDGHQAYYKCSACNKFFNSNKNPREWSDLVISAIGHEYGSVSYSWNATKTECIATRCCVHNCNEEGHIQTSSATITSTVTQYSSCVKPRLTTYTATFTDSWCATQTSVITGEPTGHNDADNDHDCDDCGTVVSSCIDENTDGKCDICGNSMCETCVDENKDHICENCGGRVGEHKADENSHNCSYCSQPITSCIDSDLDHKCDICSTSMGVHQGQENSHNCAYCGEKVTDHKGGTATCTEKPTCTICGEKYGSALGHSLGNLEVFEDATCTENGHEAYYKCSICNEYFDGNKVKKAWIDLIIPAKGHKCGEWSEKIDATCESFGSVGHYQCSECDKYFDIDYKEIDNITINTLPHKFGEMIDEKGATCTENGYVAHKDCSICNKHFDADGKEIEDIVIVSTGHIYGDWIDEAHAGCETTGTKEHYHCSACDTDFDIDHNKLSSLVIPVKGHTYGDWHERIDATCENVGSLAHYQCSECDKYFDSDHKEISDITINTLPHKFGEMIDEKGATCTENGYVAHKDCSICNKHFDADGKEIEDIVIVSAGHIYGEWIDEVSAGCDTTGTKGHYHCSACNTDFDAEHNKLSSLVIPVTGHTYGTWIEPVNATCEDNGSVAYKDCTVCHKHFDAENNEIENIVIPSNGHSFGEMIDEKGATCTENGYVAHKDCSVCHKHFDASNNLIEDIVIKANGHKFGDLIVAVGATCTENGVKAHKDCLECNKHFDVNGNELTSLEIVAIGHKLVKVDAKVATVETEGNIEYYRCENCGKLFKDAQGKEEIAFSETVLAKLELVIEKIDNEDVDISKDGVSFKTNGSINGKEIKVNGEVVDSSNYTITEDNIIVLNPEYLASLGNGEHVLTIGEASSEFTVDFVKEGLSGGAIAGIVIACVFVLAIIAFAIVWFVVLKKSFNDIIAIFKKK